MVFKKNIFFLNTIIFYMSHHYQSLREGVTFHFNKLESPSLESFPPRMFWTKIGWNWPCGSGEEDKNLKRVQVDEQRTERGWIVIRRDHLSELRWANKNSVQCIAKSKAYTIWQKRINPEWLESSVYYTCGNLKKYFTNK